MTIKYLRELNRQLKGQYSDEQNRNYCLQCKIDKLEKEKIEQLDNLINKGNHKPYGEELNLYENSKLRYLEILSKIEKR